MNEKVCTGCCRSLPTSEFYSDTRRGRPRSRCRACFLEQTTRAKRERLGDFGGRTREAFSNARHRAEKYGLPFDLTLEWVRERASAGVCEATGLPFHYTNTTNYRSNPYGPSLDRIDPRGGYTQDNTRVVITAFNLMRNEYDDELVYQVFTAWRARADDGLRDAHLRSRKP